MNPKVLLATPVYDGKEYAVASWAECAKAYTYPHESLLVDNSETPEFYEHWRDRVPMVRIEATGGVYFERLAQAAEHIRRYFLARDFDRWVNLDVDEWSEPDLIDYLLRLMGDADCLNHASPNRQLDMWIDGGFGCVVFNRAIMQSLSFNDCPPNVAHDVWFYRALRSEFVVKRTRGTRILQHLDGEGQQAFGHEMRLRLP